MILALGLAGRVLDPAPIQDLRLLVFDTFQRLAPRPYEDAPVRVVDIDDASLEKVGQWPWPRTVVAGLVRRLADLGAAAIVFDIVFAEPDRTSPRQILPLWPDGPAARSLRRQAEILPDHDQILADAFADAGTVVTGFVLTNGALVREPARKKGFAYGGDDPLLFVPRYAGAVTNLPGLEDAAAGNGSFNRVTDRDGTVRRLPTALALSGRLYPSLLLEALRIAQGGGPAFLVKASGASGEASAGEKTGISQVRVGGFTLPTTSDGSLIVHFTGYRPERYIPAWRVLHGEASPDDVDGMILLIGTSAAGLKDQVPTPLSPVTPGVEVHAQAIEQVVLGRFLSRPDWADGAEILYLLVLGVVLLALLRRLGALWGAMAMLGATTGAVAFSWHAYREMHFLLDPVYPAVFIVLVYMTQTVVNFLRVESEKRQVRGAFGRYLSPTLVERLASNPDQLRLGGEIRTMTFLFCDIRGFTTISEQFDAEGLTRFINRFLTPMTDLILTKAGTIDKYMGDAIMAFWNAPLDDDDHAAHACDAALAMQEKLKELNEVWHEDAVRHGRTHHIIQIGIGINSGEACVGNMGSDQRFDYSVLGDDVNLASRLEGQSKTYDVGIVIGENTREHAPGFATLELDLIRVKGKNRPVRIFALLGGPAVADSPAFRALALDHAAMIDAYRHRNWDEAEAALNTGRQLAAQVFGGGLDGLYALYRERITAWRASPPGPDWDGTITATTK